ncbi:Ubiquitin carboxyl-terminal hydrolase 31 [Desmophyllum pertusum]|uniref:ubiquitinyl hydrolase 1 n=1 Tax=Desmophyllum pertusum TaxID=174260 RepID=A0A9X0CPC9_9CNID|nr:Ubiquitin carboxyl-terminal hydrolase 31 [Desmophyllum pertusum]
MTQEELDQEREMQRKQLEEIFKLLETDTDKFGVTSMDDLQAQMKLYTVPKKFGLPFIVRVLRELSYENLQAAMLKAMSRILFDNVSSQVKKQGLLFRLRVVNGALMSCGSGSGPQHIKMIAEWEPETRVSPVFCKKDQRNTAACVKWSLYITAHIMLDWRTGFKLYTKDEKLGSEDAWLCPRCKKLQQGTVKRLSLWTLPEVLVVHLKRFRQTSAGRTKLHTLVDFPLMDLDMNAHLEPRNKRSSPVGTWRRQTCQFHEWV